MKDQLIGVSNASYGQRKKTALETSAATDEKQSLLDSNNSITDNDKICNPNDEDLFEEFREEGRKDYMRTVTMDELFDCSYLPKPPVIDDFLYRGLYIFAGAPKVGKSFLMAQLGYSVSMGFDLWGRRTRQSTVLYLALEDNYQRLQGRLNTMFGIESTDNFVFSTQAHNIGSGLEEQIERFVREHKSTSLVIIDTLQKVRNKDSEKCCYSTDYQIITALKKLADRLNICILVVHHTRKQDAEDTFDAISGTNGLLGAADGAFLLQKEKRSGNKAKLSMTGRDQPDQCLHLEFDTAHCLWQLTKVENELFPEPKDETLELLAKFISADNPKYEGSATELIQLLDIGLSANALTRKLNVSTSKLYRDYNIYYRNVRNSQKRIVILELINDDE